MRTRLSTRGAGPGAGEARGNGMSAPAARGVLRQAVTRAADAATSEAEFFARLRADGYEVEDFGALALDGEDDYPDFVTPCAKRVVEENQFADGAARAFGIVLGGSGQGEAMCANRVSGVRAAVFYGEPQREQTDANGTSLGMVASMRAHNDANILSLGARFLSDDDAYAAALKFLATPFSLAERHVRRLAKF